MGGHQHGRSKGEDDILKDAKAMLAAAKGDAAVSKKLGAKYLKHVDDDVAQAESLEHTKEIEANAATGEGQRVLHLAENLLSVMQDVRDDVKIAGAEPNVQRDFGVGADWKATSPDKLAAAAHAMVAAISAHAKVVSAAGIDAQHRHDLKHFADAIDQSHAHHQKLRADRKDGTAARAHVFAALGADAHHIRLVAGRVHRTQPDLLAHYDSPVPQHVIVHRKNAAPASPPG